MQSIYKAKSSVKKNYPVWRKISKRQTPDNKDCAKKIIEPPSESLLQLNEIAKKYPFCIMYHTTEHDTL
jgi:hypothetical protein